MRPVENHSIPKKNKKLIKPHHSVIRVRVFPVKRGLSKISRFSVLSTNAMGGAASQLLPLIKYFSTLPI